MTRSLRIGILAGLVGLGGLLGTGAATVAAKADDYGHPGYGPGFAVGEPYGYGYGGYGRGYGHGRGYGGYGRGYGYGYGRPRTYYYSQTTITTIIYCDSCGRYHDRYAPCGGGH